MTAALWVVWAVAVAWIVYVVAGAHVERVSRLPYPPASVSHYVAAVAGSVSTLPLLVLMARSWGAA